VLVQGLTATVELLVGAEEGARHFEASIRHAVVLIAAPISRRRESPNDPLGSARSELDDGPQGRLRASQHRKSLSWFGHTWRAKGPASWLASYEKKNKNKNKNKNKTRRSAVAKKVVMVAILPQLDPKSEARRSALARQQRKYIYKHSLIEPLALLEEVPRADKPSLRWWITVMKVVAENLANSAAIKVEQASHGIISFADDDDESAGVKADLELLIEDAERIEAGELEGMKPGELDGDGDGPVSFGDGDGFWSRVKRRVSDKRAEREESDESAGPKSSVADRAESSMVAEIEAALAKAANSFLSKGDTPPRVEGRATSLADYDALFCTIDIPAIRDTYQLDRTFARMRLAGPNPAMIERVKRPSSNIPITEVHYQVAMDDAEDNLDLAGAEGRLFQLDYAGLNGLLEGTYPGYRKYMPAPIALFAIPRSGDDRKLCPVAIQTEQRTSSASPVLTPADGEAWLVAKNAVQVADGCYHEAVAHLARTHLLVEPFVIATKRQLSQRHPLYILLEPHFEGTLYINDSAQSSLIAAEGGVNRLLAPAIDSSRLAAILGLQSFPFDQAGFEEQLIARGVGDPAKLPDYPFRDDGRLIWAAIKDWVSRYIALYYADDGHVSGDFELQAWAAELLSFEGGRVVGFGQDGGVKTRDYLIKTVTTLIFIASAQHAAVNFPQGSIMSYTPAQPLAAYAPSTPGASLLDVLPPLDQALAQTELGRSLGLAYYTQLGRYKDGTFRDPRVAGPLSEFQAELERIEAVIVERNKHREPYTELLPSKIPQSINI